MQLTLAAKLDVINHEMRDVLFKALDAEGYPYINMGRFGKISTADHINSDYEEIWVFNKCNGLPAHDERVAEALIEYFKQDKHIASTYNNICTDMANTGNSSLILAFISTLKTVFEEYDDTISQNLELQDAKDN